MTFAFLMAFADPAPRVSRCDPCAPKEDRNDCCECEFWVRLGRRSTDPGACPVLGMNTMERGGGCVDHFERG